MLPGLPDELMARTGPVTAMARPPQGGFYDVTILTAARGRFVLKVGTSPERIAELHQECRVLAALRGEAPFVPQPLAHAVDGAAGLFLFTCVEGENLLAALEQESSSGRHRLIAEAGKALRRIHGWQPEGRRPGDWFAAATAAAARNVAAGQVANPVDHSGRFGGMDPHDLLAYVQRGLRDQSPDPVYGHGDFCLPNILADHRTVSGIVDWSRGAYADRRIDLAAGVWSIRHNLQDEAYVQTFLNGYGYTGTADSLRPFEALWVLS